MVALEIIKSSQLFRGLDDSTAGQIASLAQQEAFHVDEVIYRENDEADRLYILEDGEVTEYVATGPDPGVLVTSVADEGEVFGCASMLESRRHVTTAVCLRHTRAASVDAEALAGLLSRDPSAGYVVASNLAQVLYLRLQDARDQIKTMFLASLGQSQPAP